MFWPYKNYVVTKFSSLGRHNKSNVSRQTANSLNKVGYSTQWNNWIPSIKGGHEVFFHQEKWKISVLLLLSKLLWKL